MQKRHRDVDEAEHHDELEALALDRAIDDASLQLERSQLQQKHGDRECGQDDLCPGTDRPDVPVEILDRRRIAAAGDVRHFWRPHRGASSRRRAPSSISSSPIHRRGRVCEPRSRPRISQRGSSGSNDEVIRGRSVRLCTPAHDLSAPAPRTRGGGSRPPRRRLERTSVDSVSSAARWAGDDDDRIATRPALVALRSFGTGHPGRAGHSGRGRAAGTAPQAAMADGCWRYRTSDSRRPNSFLTTA